MSSGKTTALWMGFAGGLALAVTTLVVALLGAGERGLGAALFVTGRLAFLFFWPAYVGAALVSLFGPAFTPVKRRSREYGLAFASIIAVHAVTVACLCLIGASPSTTVFVVFGVALTFTILLSSLSFGNLHQRVGRRGWRFIRTVGMNYIAFAFAVDFTRDPLHGGPKHVLEYMPFAVLAITGPSLRIAASVKHLVRPQRAIAE